jgi:hypothetical protein
MPRSLAVISRSPGSHLALSLFAHAFIFAGQLPRFRIPNSTHLVFVNSPAFCVLSASTTSRPPFFLHKFMQTTGTRAQSFTFALSAHTTFGW